MTDPSSSSRDLLALTLTKGLGPVRLARLLGACESPRHALSAPLSFLKRIEGIGPTTARAIVESRSESLQRAESEIDKTHQSGARIVTILDEDYPHHLKPLTDAPPVLRIKGELDPTQRAVAVVGSRKCTIYGTEQARRFSMTLSGANLSIVSGGARGIDASAHKSALDAGGSTIVVLGCGLGQTYPPEHKDLFDRVVNSGGALVSELPHDTPPSAENFPARNRIISGLSLATLVVEAALRSGALITARHALEDHGREVFAVPGRVDSPSSEGSNALIRDGAHAALDPRDIIDVLDRSTATRSPSAPSESPIHTPIPHDLDPDQTGILEALDQPRTPDQLSEITGLDPARVRAASTMLEIQGRIRRAGSRFERAR